jgi:hypothetical protein
MAGGTNKKRARKTTGEETSLWGFLFDKNTQNQDITKRAFFAQPGEEETEEAPAAPHHILVEIWKRFNFWSLLAILIFLAFSIVLISTTVSMWTPQNMRNIAGYADHGSARDLLALLRNANGQEISFTEAEINRYLRDTCRMRQTGIFSIITHGEGVAVKIHNGYAELIIDRILGANIHQTTSVHLTFHQEINHGRPELKVAFHGSEKLYGKLPKGGSIGRMGLPERHIRMLAPALDTLLACYPEIHSIIEEHGYCPYFTQGENGVESRVSLIPYRPS